jgi:type I restriction enzyme S subunit
MSFPRYPKYKDSGVEWLGQVPEHWEVKPNKAFLTMLKSEVGETWSEKTLLSLTLNGVIPRDVDGGGKFPAEFNAYQDVAENDIVFCLFDIDETPRTVGLAQAPGMITGAYDVFRCNDQTNPKFVVYYYLHIDAFKGLRPFYTGLRKVVRPPTFMAVKIPLPPLPEQIRIAAFLDQETAKIDALVAEQQRLMELLKEKRQAVISHAVTKGLNPKAALKPSGIEWLGDVPAHWEVTKIKRLASRISSGKTPLGGSEIYVDEGITFLRSQNIYDEGLRLDDVVFITEAVDEAMSVSRVKANDILLNITGASIGRSCVVPSELPSANVNQHVCVIRLENSSQVPFVGWLFKSATIKNQIDHAQNGAAREGLNFVQIGTMSVALPPAAEQESIASFLNLQTVQLDALNAEAQRAIDLLQERRTALISAAVTGQIDVRKT